MSFKAYIESLSPVAYYPFSSVTGAYTLLTPTDAECSVVCLDDADGTTHNDLILRVTP